MVFRDDDAGYQRWLESHRSGYVLNTLRRPGASYLKVHRASCQSISELQSGRRGWTTGEYAKVCGDEISVLDNWAQQEAGGTLQDGCYCMHFV